MIRSNITVARIPPVMTTVPAVIRMALHQHPAEIERRGGWAKRAGRERISGSEQMRAGRVKGQMMGEKAHNSSVQ